MKKTILFIYLFLIVSAVWGQSNFSCFVKDETTKTNIIGVTAMGLKTKQTALSNDKGRVFFKTLATGKNSIQFSFVGYQSKEITVFIPQGDTIQIIYLQRVKNELDEVIVTSSRSNSRIEDLPTKVEVLGSEEVKEEGSIKPGNIASMLGDVAGIQIQQTSATTGNADARVQGLPGKYTQILRDGLPLYGGYAGGFSIMQIPPSDLKQIEIIKGSSSTLYGGGAIAGMINLISKTPKLNTPEKAVVINQSTLKESNLNLYLSNRKNKIGYTFFTGGTYQKAVDVNKDGLSDVPDLKTFFLHPKIFFYPNKNQDISVGYNLTYEDRNGGDMQVLHHSSNSSHQFFIQNITLRNAITIESKTKLNAADILTMKATGSFFAKNIASNVFGMKANQQSFFSEIAYLKKFKKHSLVSGINFSGEIFKKKTPDSTKINNYQNSTLGLFVQDDWKVFEKCIVQSGVRLEHISNYGAIFLPRLSLLYKIKPSLSTRLGGGFGYKTPSVFANEIDERDYKYIVQTNTLLPEKSKGINWDINFKKLINGWHITANQMFYYTAIKQAIIQYYLPTDYNIYFANAAKPLTTKGFETYIAATKDELEVYLGYTFTNAKQLYNPQYPNVSLSAKNKIATVISYELSDKWRVGLENAYTGKQYLDDGSTTSPYLFAAAMVRYNFKNISLVLNCENLFDYRQNKKESIYTGSITSPVFKQIWAPLDGRVINLSAKISW